MTPTAVSFFSNDIRLTGDLHLPDEAALPLPAVVMAPSVGGELPLMTTQSTYHPLASARDASPLPRETALSPPAPHTGDTGRQHTRAAQVGTS
ncbi:hypothetical protein [Streptomyces sp. NPDC001652]|uniref:hypothetical protein n=1 Tax=Streptomyces sp. NPDC001652 TaxID=3154393 RepID=UPI003330C2A2